MKTIMVRITLLCFVFFLLKEPIRNFIKNVDLIKLEDFYLGITEPVILTYEYILQGKTSDYLSLLNTIEYAVGLLIGISYIVLVIFVFVFWCVRIWNFK